MVLRSRRVSGVRNFRQALASPHPVVVPRSGAAYGIENLELGILEFIGARRLSFSRFFAGLPFLVHSKFQIPNSKFTSSCPRGALPRDL
jgi:hypothetical protein